MSDETTSHSTRLANNTSQVAGYDETTSHSTKLANNTSQVAGYSGVVIPKEQLTAFERWELPSFDTLPGGKSGPRAQKHAPPITVAELDSLRQQAHDAGYAAGIQHARDEAAQIHVLAQNLQDAIHLVDEQIAQSLLDLSLEVARQMVREALLVKPEVILKIVGDAIGSLPHFNHNAHLVLHPDDAELVRKQMGEQLSHAGWKIFTDAQIRRGGCRVETSHSHVDATVEARWKRIVESIGQDKSWQA